MNRLTTTLDMIGRHRPKRDALDPFAPIGDAAECVVTRLQNELDRKLARESADDSQKDMA